MTHPLGQPLPGTRPPGTTDEAAAARFVRQLFSDVAGRYDLLNHLLSLNVDRYWRWAVAREFSHWLSMPSARVLDLCCGTADLSLAFVRRVRNPGQGIQAIRGQARPSNAADGNALIISSDFSHPMLTRAQQKLEARSPKQEARRAVPRRRLLPLLAEADALQLPFRNGCFDLVASAFGFRNLVNYHGGLAEIRRVLRPGGEIGILEFSEPSGKWIGPIYSYYFHTVLPAIAEWLTGVRGAYRYLASSVDRFPGRNEFLEWMRLAGFEELRSRKLSGGIAILYVGRKPQA